MYNNIEEIYKKKSPYNRTKIKTFWTYVLSFPFLLFFSYSKHYFMMLLTFIIICFIMKKTYEKILNEKLFFSFPIFKKKLRTISLNTLILENEKKIFVDYLKSNFMYKKETIKIIMEHYRCYIKPKVVGGNFLSILSILISVLLAFVSKDGFDIKSFEISIPYLVSLVFLFLIVYLPLSNITKIRKFFSGEDGMVERLESIFSELYIEYDETINVKNTMKTKKVVLKGKRERLLKEISNSHRS